MIDLKKFKGIIPQDEVMSIQDYSIKLDFLSTHKKSYIIDRPNKRLVIHVNSIPKKEQKNLKTIISSCINNNTAILIAEDKVSLLDKLYQYNDAKDKQILAFFQPIFSRVDWEALRDSLYLRNAFKNREDIHSLKEDIRARYGERGNTISNLCTAGYFEEVFIPLFNSSPLQTEFWQYYNLSLEMGLTALFVHAQMTIETINSEIKRRIELGKKYGLKFIHIHGIGEKNIKNIKKFIQQEKGKLNFTEKNIFTNESSNILIVELIL